MTIPLRSLLAAPLVLALTTAAAAHEWYDPFCCSDKDCTSVPDSAVSIVPGVGYRIVLGPLDHPMVTRPLEAVVPFGEQRISEDGDFHVCVYPKDVLRCFYDKPRGM